MSTAEKIKVMQAYLEGKQLQVKFQNQTSWQNHADVEPFWEWGVYDYRIKPSSRFKVFVSIDGANWLPGGHFHLKDDADQFGKLLLKKIGYPWKYYKIEEEEE